MSSLHISRTPSKQSNANQFTSSRGMMAIHPKFLNSQNSNNNEMEMNQQANSKGRINLQDLPDLTPYLESQIKYKDQRDEHHYQRGFQFQNGEDDDNILSDDLLSSPNTSQTQAQTKSMALTIDNRNTQYNFQSNHHSPSKSQNIQSQFTQNLSIDDYTTNINQLSEEYFNQVDIENVDAYLPEQNQIKLATNQIDLIRKNQHASIFKDYTKAAPDRENLPNIKDLFTRPIQDEKK
eukprot:403344903